MEPAKRGWWSRNWKWVVPVGCLTPVLVCGGGLTLILSLLFGMIKSSDAYTQSLAAAQANPSLQQAIGTPIEPGFLVTGNLEYSGSSASADLSYSVSGPQGDANIYVVGQKAANAWTYSILEAVVHTTGERIELQP